MAARLPRRSSRMTSSTNVSIASLQALRVSRMARGVCQSAKHQGKRPLRCISIWCMTRHLHAVETRRAATSSAARSGATAVRGGPFRPLHADGLFAARQAPPARNRDTLLESVSVFCHLHLGRKGRVWYVQIGKLDVKTASSILRLFAAVI